jgi:hypothetical protein
MPESYITENEAAIDRRHYVMNATAANHFYNFYTGRVSNYRSQYQEDFCLIINGSKIHNDAYVLPFSAFKDFLSADYLVSCL